MQKRNRVTECLHLWRLSYTAESPASWLWLATENTATGYLLPDHRSVYKCIHTNISIQSGFTGFCRLSVPVSGIQWDALPVFKDSDICHPNFKSLQHLNRRMAGNEEEQRQDLYEYQCLSIRFGESWPEGRTQFIDLPLQHSYLPTLFSGLCSLTPELASLRTLEVR